MNKPIINSTFETTAGTENVDLRKKEEHKRLNIHTFMAHENEVCLAGTDEHGKELCMWFDAYEFIQWVDLQHIKETLTKHINKI
jgi:hypothetical protein